MCWDGIKAKGKGKERHLFLLENLLICAKRNEGNLKTKDDFSYAVKFALKVLFFSFLFLLISFNHTNSMVAILLMTLNRSEIKDVLLSPLFLIADEHVDVLRYFVILSITLPYLPSAGI